MTGAVLHVLPTLEKVVSFRSSRDRALKILRAEIPISLNSTRQLVGVHFPIDDGATDKLLDEMQKLEATYEMVGTVYSDEALSPICPKSRRWATSKRKTMKNFFEVKSKEVSTPTKGVERTSNCIDMTVRSKKRVTPDSSKVLPTKKKMRSITSFFKKK